MDAFVEAEERIESQRSREMQESSSRISQWLLGGVALNVVLGIALANYFSIGTIRRLHTLMDNTFRMSARKQLNPPVGGGDEIAHLDTVFHQMARDLDDAAKRKQEMVAMVTHDLRTPLMSMQTVLELLSEGVMGELPQKARHEISVAQFSTERLIQLINDLLDIDKLEAGKFELSKREADAGWLFERCIHSVKAFADRNQVSISVPDEDDDVVVYADPDRLAQVITNLLSNAIKFSPPGSEVQLICRDLPEATLFQIIDQGRGIPAGYEHRIFERFQQVDASDPREKKGSGLGLAICKALIDAHNGTIGVESKPGRGSNFWFKIPKQQTRRSSPRDTAAAK
jgi:signal transduction histidine kinase